MVTSRHDLIQSVLDRHDRLELDHEDGDAGRFLSGWQCVNPWATELLQRVDCERRTVLGEQYQYVEHDELILDTIRAFHKKTDGTLKQDVLPAPGSTPLLFAYCMHLLSMKVSEVYYIPPLYYSLHSALRLFGIRARPISGRHPYEPNFTINLPRGKNILLLSDPTWYSGTAIGADKIREIAAWQIRTGSQIMVDGSFQYMRWNPLEAEPTSEFVPELTARIICPTKLFSLHGYRFAYLLGSQTLCRRLSSHLGVTVGSSPVDTIAVGRVAVREMVKGTVGRALVDKIMQTHADLRLRKRIRSKWNPKAGYFVFEQPTSISPSVTLMDGAYFEQRRYRNHRRINLLSPSIGLLG